MDGEGSFPSPKTLDVKSNNPFFDGTLTRIFEPFSTVNALYLILGGSIQKEFLPTFKTFETHQSSPSIEAETLRIPSSLIHWLNSISASLLNYPRVPLRRRRIPTRFNPRNPNPTWIL
jgi:hypothetical protein